MVKRIVKVIMGGLLWMTGKWKKSGSFVLEVPFCYLYSLMIGILIYPTDHVVINPHDGTFLKINLYSHQLYKLRLPHYYTDLPLSLRW